MKKFIITLIIGLATVFTANAQFYVGGSISLSAAQGGASFTLSPEAGYNINENMAAGAIFGFSIQNSSSFSFYPYFRYNFFKFGPVSIFADGEVGMDILAPRNEEARISFGAGVRPGISVSPLPHITLATRLGALGYYGGVFQFNTTTTIPSITAYYVF